MPLDARPERARFAAFLVATLALAAASCAKPSSPSREVADRFMELYYAQMNVAEAAKLCSGAARIKLEGELKLLQGVPPDPPSGEPRVSFSLTESSTPTPGEATYTYRVTAHTADVGTVTAALTVSDEGDRWLITSFTERESPAPS
jgi:hypothetical protein